MNREVHVRFWERLGVRFPRATRHEQANSLKGEIVPGGDMSPR